MIIANKAVIDSIQRVCYAVEETDLLNDINYYGGGHPGSILDIVLDPYYMSMPYRQALDDDPELARANRVFTSLMEIKRVGSAKNKFNKSVDVYQAKYRGYLDKEILVYFTEEFTEVEKIVTWEEVD